MAPVRKMTRKEIGLQERPWINHTIIEAMSERDKLHKDFLTETNPTVRNEKHQFYKTKRNMVTSQLRNAKKEYFNDFFEEHQNNIKETWKGIRNLINVSKKSTTNINKLMENGKEITNPMEMADILNRFYVNIGKTVEEKIPKCKKTFLHYLTDRNAYNIVINPCTNEEIKIYISNMNVSKATGPNSIPTNLLKHFTDELIEPLVTIINKSLIEGIFPDILKCASVCPIYKKVIELTVQTTDQFRFFPTSVNI